MVLLNKYLKVKSFIISLSIIVLFLINSCATTNINQDKIKINNKIYFGRNNLNYLFLKGNISINAPAMKQDAQYKININSVDSLSLSLLGPFGIVGAKLYANPDYFLFYNVLQDEAYQGKPTSYNMYSLISVPVSYKDLLSIIRNDFYSSEKKYTISENNENYILYLYNSINDSTNNYYHYSKLNNAVELYTKINKDNDTLVSISYKEYKNTDNINFPRKILMNFHKANVLIKMSIDDIIINQESNKQMIFSISKSTKIIDLDKK